MSMDPVLDVCVREPIMDPVLDVCVRVPIADTVLDAGRGCEPEYVHFHQRPVCGVPHQVC